MKFTKKFLEDLGIENEKIEKIFNAHTEITEALKTDFENLKNEISEKEIHEKKSGSMRKILREKGYSEKGIEKILKYRNYHEKTEFDENFNMKNAENFIKNVENEWGEFKPVETKTFSEPPTPPANSAINSRKSEISKLTENYYNKLYGPKKED